MTDPVREPCKRSDGLTKRGWNSHAAAKKASRRATRSPEAYKGKGPLRPYKCPKCFLYHLGHTQPGRDRRETTDC